MIDTVLGVFRSKARTGFQVRGNRLYLCTYRLYPNEQGKRVWQWVPAEWVPVSALADYEATDVASQLICDAARLGEIEDPPIDDE